MPAHTDGTNGTGMGTQTPTPKPGVISPFHAGGGGGGGGSGAATQVLDGGSNTVPTRIRLRYSPPAKPVSRMQRRKR